MNLADLDGLATAAYIAKGEISAAEALEAAIARAEAVNPQINAFANTYFDRARATKPQKGPLAGLPFLVKDLLDWRGAATTYGSAAFQNTVAQTQTPYIDALEAAGVVIFGKTTTPERGLSPATEPVLTGPTRNPWNLDHSAGGSSGGAAAAVAARIVPIAHASDGGGSIRIPASCCGLFGFKPSRNRLADDGMAAPVRVSSHHVVSRTVRDSAAAFAATERRGADRAFPPIGNIAAPSQRRLRIAVMAEAPNGLDIHDDVVRAVDDAVALCRALDHDTVEARPPIDAAQLSRAFFIYWSSTAAAFVKKAQDHLGPELAETRLEPLTLTMADYFNSQPQSAFDDAVSSLNLAAEAYNAWFEDIDVLLTPTATTPPPPIGYLGPQIEPRELLKRNGAYVPFTQLQNIAGAPAMSVPLSMSKDGLPIGVHFAGRAGDDKTLFELAYELEAARPWADKKPPVCA